MVLVCATDGDGEWADEADDLAEKTEVDGRILADDDMDSGELNFWTLRIQYGSGGASVATFPGTLTLFPSG